MREYKCYIVNGMKKATYSQHFDLEKTTLIASKCFWPLVYYIVFPNLFSKLRQQIKYIPIYQIMEKYLKRGQTFKIFDNIYNLHFYYEVHTRNNLSM